MRHFMTDPRPSSPLHLSPEAMRELGYRAVDALVARWSGLSEQPAWIGADRRDTQAWFAEAAPRSGRPPAEVLQEALDSALERAGRVDHPRFFAFVPSAPTWPGVIADFLASGYNVFQGTWLESAGPSQVELIVLDWFREWIGYPEGASGLLTSGGSAATLTALAAARLSREAEGRPRDKQVIYLSDQSHYSVARAARVVGIPRDHIRTLPTTANFRMDVEALGRALARDTREGFTPVAVVATAGTTNTGAVDPLGEIADICRDAGVWLHVDAAYGGFAFQSDRCTALFDGLDRADSITLDPHKWLFQPYEIGCLMAREPQNLVQAFRVIPEYLQDVELGAEHVNFADRGLQLTRSFRALKVWMSIQTFGVDAFTRAVDASLDLAERAEDWMREREDMEVLSPAALGVVCYRLNPRAGNLTEDQLAALNQAVQEDVVRSGLAMLSSTRINGHYSLRLCILNHATTWDDVRMTLEAVLEAGAARVE